MFSLEMVGNIPCWISYQQCEGIFPLFELVHNQNGLLIDRVVIFLGTRMHKRFWSDSFFSQDWYNICRDIETLSTPYLANVIGNFLSTSMMRSDTIKLNFLIIVIDGSHGDW